MKIRLLSSLGLILVLVVTLLFCGCVSWTYGREDVERTEPYAFSGPGSTDCSCSLIECVNIDPGHRMSVGFCPGAAEPWTQGFENGEGGWGGEIASTLALNVSFLLVPTISSLLISPFYENEISRFGLIGCHRWTVDQVEPEELRWTERRLRQTERAPRDSSVSSRPLPSGELLFSDYPGFPTLHRTVLERGSAVVAVKNGRAPYRRFKRSRKAKGVIYFTDIQEDELNDEIHYP